MAIVIHCPCGKTLSTRDENAGKRARCPACGAILPIPELDEDFVDADFHGPPGAYAPPTLSPMSPPLRFGARPPESDFDEDSEGYELAPPPAPTQYLSPSPIPIPIPERPPAFVPQRFPAVERDWGRKRQPEPATEREGFDPESDDLHKSPREYLYLVLIVALVPLGLSLMRDKDDLKERIERTFHVKGEALKQILSVPKEELLKALPDGRIEGALLAHDSARHWLFAGMSAFGFLSLLVLMFPQGRAKPWHLFAVGLFTATIGIFFLLLVQWAADSAGNFQVRGKAMIFWLILLFIGFSYRAALDPSQGFLVSLLGFTLGVGLCEEMCKALPLLWIYRRSGTMTWRQACLWGLASGIGFGVSEGVMYSGDHYNGLHTGGIYVVRFVSCVALHAIWGASVGMALDRRWDAMQGHDEGWKYLCSLLKVIGVPMLLHGLYDTTLKKDMNFAALMVAVASFAWFTWQVESSRIAEGGYAPSS